MTQRNEKGRGRRESNQMKKKVNRKRLITGRDPVDQLYRAVQRYVLANKGTLIVVGGISVMELPGDAEHSNFYICVKCTGGKPEFALKEPDIRARGLRGATQ